MRDWLQDALRDAIWSKFFAFQGLYRLYKGEPQQAVGIVASLCGTCQIMRSLRNDIWFSIPRPYLALCDVRYAYRTLLLELAQRHMIADIRRHLLVVEIDNVCVAGGFASWQLERTMDAHVGRDGYPRAVRTTLIWDGHRRNEVWIPGDVDIFVGCAPSVVDIVLDIVGMCYDRFHQSILPTGFITRHRSADRDYEEADGETAGDVGGRCTHIAHVAREHGLSEDMVRTCVTAVHDNRNENPRVVVEQAWAFTTSLYAPLLPTRLNVIFTVPPDNGGPYKDWIMDTFDMWHCRVTCEVDDEEGTYTFYASQTAVDALRKRQIVFTTEAFPNRRHCLRTVQRVAKYVANGFSVHGDR